MSYTIAEDKCDNKKRKFDSFMPASEYAKLTKEERKLLESQGKTNNTNLDEMSDQEKDIYFKNLYEEKFASSMKVKLYHPDGRSEMAMFHRVFSSRNKNFITLKNKDGKVLQWIKIDEKPD